MSGSFAPLTGTTVLDLSRYLPGPYLTRILADLGATVIKVESPGGDTVRYTPPFKDGKPVIFTALNAGKQSVALDLKKPEASAVLLAMAEKADVLVEGFRPGVMARLGASPEQLLARNPRLIVCSLSGFGQSTPHAGVAGHDIDYLARSGVLGLWGPAGGPPQTPGVQIADVGAGSLQGALGVLAALIDRDKTGRGRHLDISLTRGAFSFGVLAMLAAAVGQSEERASGYLTGGMPCYRTYAVQDGFVAVGALEPHFWANLCKLGGHPDLVYEGHSRDPAIHARCEAMFMERTRAGWAALVEGHDTCLEPVRTPEEALADPDLASLVHDLDGFPVVHAELGVREPCARPSMPPEIGSDALAVMEALEIDPALVAAARAADAMPIPET